MGEGERAVPCRMARSRKVQSIDRGRTALAAGRTVRKVGSDGVTEYMADGGMSAEALYLLVIHGDVEPELLGPFSTESSRTDRARLHREEHWRLRTYLYRVNATGTVDVDSYTGREIEPTDESEQVAMGLDPIPDDTPSLDPPWWEAR